MRRREFITAISAAAAWPRAARAQRSSRRALIGVLLPTTPAIGGAFLEALRKGLRELGHVEGQNVAIEVRFGHGVVSDLPALAAELAALDPAVIVTGSDAAVLAQRRATTTIPIVMASLSGDPVSLGLAASFARPGANVTGITFYVVDASGHIGIVGKQMGLLRELRPGLARIGLVFDPDDPIGTLTWKSAQEAGHALQIRCTPFEVRRTADLVDVFATASRERMEALIIAPLPLFTSQLRQLVSLATQTRVPVIYGLREFVVAGGLMSYGANLVTIWQRSASFVDKILKGARPAELPIEQPTVFEFVFNAKAAKALGIEISPQLLARADEVIE